MKNLIEKEFLLPSLAIGVPESVFWEKTPKTIQVYFDAYSKRKEMETNEWLQRAWIMGAYVRKAISSSVFVAGLYNGKGSIPEYPKEPIRLKNENNPDEMTEERKEIERQRLVSFLNSLGKHKK